MVHIDDLSSQILEFLEKYPHESFRSKELARRLGYRSPKEYEAFKQVLFRLKDEGRVARVQGKMYQHLYIPQKVMGTLRMTRQSFGFVIPEDGSEDVFVAQRNLEHATHGDMVEVALFMPNLKKKKEGDRREGEVVRIMQRGRTEIVGTLERVRKALFVIPDDVRIAPSVLIAEEDAGEAKPGEKVVVRVESWGEEHFQPVGKIVEVLGNKGNVRAEMLSVMRDFGLTQTFPPEVLAEADAFPDTITRDMLAERKDIRALLCVTIDPVDAKDFDDALSLEQLAGGGVRLGVHIADVSAYVREGTPLDDEARRRGTSVYLPNMVVPMLPERLSGNLCSLRPDEDRLAFTVFLTLNAKGAVSNIETAETVIRSKRRFTYEEVQRIIDGDAAARKKESPDVIAMVEDLHRLTSMLTKKRMKEGSIDFDSPEATFVFDAEGSPEAIHRKQRLESHRLVEECMLMANKVVAKEFGVHKGEEGLKPFIFRVHDLPDPMKIRELASFVKTFGYKLNVEGNIRSKDLQKLMENVRGSDVEVLINEVAIRSMAKAVYAAENIGHFGLAFDTYTHFTSPIRRYPDLIVHRLMKEYRRSMSYGRRESLTKHLPDLAKHASDRERVAVEAERAALKVMQVTYMQRHLGDEFKGIISGIAHFGLFVEIDDLLVEGMVHVRDLDDDFYVYDEASYTLTGRRSGRRFRLGDAVDVQVVRVNPDDRRIDFRIVAPGAPQAATNKPTRRR